MTGQAVEKSDKNGETLADKLSVPSNKLMILVPVLGIASLIALGTVVVLGITMLEMLVRHAEVQPEQLDRLTRQIEELSERVRQLELSQKDMDGRIASANRLASELYLTRPQTELEKERARLSKLPPAELLKQGLTALNRSRGRPVLYFEAILEEYPDSPEAPAAMLNLGMLRVRVGDYAGAVELFKGYLSQYGKSSAYDTARANFYLGVALDNLGRKKEAVQYYEAPLSSFPKSDLFRAMARANLGELYLRRGEKEKAVRQFEALLEEFDGEKRALNILKRAREMLKSLRDD